MPFTKVAPAGIGTEPGDGYRIGDSFLHATGLSAGNATFSGIVTASSFVGSGSGLTGVASTDHINSSTNAVLSGIVTAGTLNVSGNANVTGTLGVGGTLTYEDVTNIDSVGVITARSGGYLDIRTGSSINTNATGSSASGTIHKNTNSGEFAIVSGGTGGNNHLTFYTSASAAPTEKLRIDSSGTVFYRGSSSSDNHRLQIRVNDTDTEFRGSSNSTTNKGFAFYSSNTNSSERLRIGSAGQLGIGGANYGTSGQVLTSQGASSAVAWASLAVGKFASYAVVADANNQGNQNGGTFTSGAWRTRILDSEITDEDNIVSLSSNQFTLGAGNYFIIAWASALDVDGHQARLRDITNGATRAHGSSEYTSNSDYVTTKSWIFTRITPSSSTAYELQHRCQSTASNGFGNGSGDQWTQESNGDTYCMVIILKEV